MRIKRKASSRRSSVTTSIMGVVAAIALLVGVTACGGGSNSSSSSNGGGYADQTCFTQMSDTQRNELKSFIGDPANVTSQTDNGDGTQDICVLEDDGQGGYNQAYYRQNDGFADYYMYALMFGHSNTMMTYGLISGDLDVGQYMALRLLTGVSGNGSLYQPYSQTSAGWGRYNTVVSNKTVNHIYYNRSDAGSFATAHTQAPPAGYAAVTVKPVSDSEATVTRGANGRATVTQTASSGAHAVLSTASVVTPTPLKTNSASVSAIPNPATNSSGAGSTTAAPASTTAAAPATSQPSSQTTNPKLSTTQQAPSTTSRQSTSQRSTTAQPAPRTSRTSAAPAPTQKRSTPPKPKPTRR